MVPRRADAGTADHRELFRFPGRPGGLTAGFDGAIYVSGLDAAKIWRVQPDGGAESVLGDGAVRYQNQGDRILAPGGLAVDRAGDLFVSDWHHHRIWALSPDGDIRVVAGGASGYRDGPADQAAFRHPSDVAIGGDGTCYVADSGNHRIRAISPHGMVSTLAGSIFDFGDGSGRAGRFRRPVALDLGGDGALYVADNGNNAVRRVSLEGDVTTLAGWPPGGDGDGYGPGVGLRGPNGIAVGTDGTLWVADRDNAAVRRIDSTGTTTTLARFSGRHWPSAVAVDGSGRVIVALEGLDRLYAPETRVVALAGVR